MCRREIERQRVREREKTEKGRVMRECFANFL